MRSLVTSFLGMTRLEDTAVRRNRDGASGMTQLRWHD
jgi:hypothetical protein